MDQLLNSGVGYPYPTQPRDPRDPRSDDERMRDGCLVTIFTFIIALACCALIGSLASCSTHKDVCGITTSEGDALTQYIEQTANVAKQDTNIVQSANVFNSSAVESTEAEEIETETVNEQITETTDSLGNRIVTTNRTTTRQRKVNTNTQSHLDRYQRETALNIHLSYLDSLYNAHIDATATHWSDSTFKKEEHKGDSIYNSIGLWIDWAFRTLFVALLAIIVYITIKYWTNK